MSFLKEFLLGTPEEKAAKATVKILEKDLKLNRRQANTLANARRVSRRLAVRRVATGVGVAVAVSTPAGAYLLLRSSGETQPVSQGQLSPEFTTQQQTDVDVDVQRVEPTLPLESKSIDTAYLRKLFESLRQEKSTPEARSRAILDNTGIIALYSGEKGTALMIDEAGYWLTAAHLVASLESGLVDPNPFPPFIHDPNRNVIHQVTSVLHDPLHDIAIAFAPTGKPNKPVEHMQINDYEFKGGLPLWQIGVKLHRVNDNTFFVRKSILHGRTDLPPTTDSNSNYIQGLIRVRDMIPFGGSSGGPIIDARGNVVGVESGYYSPPDKPIISRKDYTGSTISPIKYALQLLKRTPYTYPLDEPRG